MNVVVLGAGIIGVSVAEALAVRGARVTVLDMRSAGQGASQAAAGILAPYVEAHDNQALLDLCVRSLDLFDGYVEQLVQSTGLAVEYARSGTLEVALDGDDEARLQVAGLALNEAGVQAEWLDEDAVREFEPSVTPAAHGGLMIHAHGLVGVASLMRALVARARFSGVVFESPIEAASVESFRDRAEVRAGTYRYEADAVVIATGSWSRRVRVANVAALPMRPVRGQLLHLQWCESDQPGRVVWGPNCYAVPWSDGSLLVGATVEEVGFDEGATVSGVHTLTSAAIELLPHASGARLDAVRVGLRPALPDGLPAIGPISRAPRVVVASGHYRNGVLLAPLTGQLVARHLLDQVNDPTFLATTPDRFFDGP